MIAFTAVGPLPFLTVVRLVRPHHPHHPGRDVVRRHQRACQPPRTPRSDQEEPNETVRGDYATVELFKGAPMSEEERGEEDRQEIFVRAPQEHKDSGCHIQR